MMDFKFSVGDSVRIVPQLMLKEMVHELHNGIIPDMTVYGGDTGVISDRWESDIKPYERYYITDENGNQLPFFWCADALEPLETLSEFEPLSDTAIEGFFN